MQQAIYYIASLLSRRLWLFYFIFLQIAPHDLHYLKILDHGSGGSVYR